MINPKLKQVQEVGDGASLNDVIKITRGNTVYYYKILAECLSRI